MSRSNKVYEKYRKIRIYPTKEQQEYLDYCIDTARAVYNWALAEETKQFELYKSGKTKEQFLHEHDLRDLYTEYTSQEENNWLLRFQIDPARYIFRKIDNAFKMYFEGYNKRPRYKTKKRDRQRNKHAFRIRHDRFYFEGTYVKIPGDFKRGEMIDCKYNTGMYKDDNISFHHVEVIKDNIGRYYVGFYTEEKIETDYFEKKQIPSCNRAIGIDLNARINRRFVCSDGSIYTGRNMKSLEKHISNMNRKIMRDYKRICEMERINPDAKPSKRAQKRIMKFRKANRRISNIYMNEIHLFTRRVIDKHPTTVVMENISIKKIRQKGKEYEKAFHFIPIARYREIMEYKCKKYGIKFITASKTFPSSQMCSNCGNIHKIKPSTKIYRCPVCGFKEDRDLNAAINLEKLAYN